MLAFCTLMQDAGGNPVLHGIGSGLRLRLAVGHEALGGVLALAGRFGQLPQGLQAMGITSGVGKLFSSHPPIEERIAALQNAG